MFNGGLSCLKQVAMGIPECASLFPSDFSQMSVSASAGMRNVFGSGSLSLVYLAMAFRSVCMFVCYELSVFLSCLVH